MKLAIVHLSDFHFKDQHNPVAKRAKSLFGALEQVETLPDAYLVVLSGDIAFSGQKREYEVAANFLAEFEDLITQVESPAPVAFVSVPGNHDCDFSTGHDMRRALVESLPGSISVLEPSSEVFEHLTKAQTEFFQFSAKLSKTPQPWISNLVQSAKFVFGSKTVQVNCYNTALMSQLEEAQGQLHFPIQAAEQVKTEDNADLNLAVFHHPYNWLESNNGLAFRRHIERTADIALTGHQHVDSVFTKRNLTGERTIYLEGGVMQDHGLPQSGFNIIVVDFEKQQYKATSVEVHDGMYLPKHTPEWKLFERNNAARTKFGLAPQFAAYLNDVGTGFQHPRKKMLLLSDIYVYPDLRRRSTVKASRFADAPIVPSSQVLKWVQDQNYVAIFGPNQCGKTSLAKSLYSDLLGRANLVPIQINGHDIHVTNEESVLKVLSQACIEQYGQGWWQHYLLLDHKFRILIVDDWHKVRLTKDQQRDFMQVAKRFFGKVTIIADDLFQIQELSRKSADENPLAEFENAVIMQMGYVARGKLIDAWYTLGREYGGDEKAVARDITQTEKRVEHILGKNLLPSFPVVVIAILQAFEANHEVESKSGSYGYLHETIITSALTDISKEPGSVDKKYTFIAQIAFHVYKSENVAFSAATVQTLADDYFETYGLRIDAANLLQELLKTRLFAEIDGNYRFRYKYFYYYFVARFFRDQFSSGDPKPELITLLKDMADTVYFEDHTHILMFVLYLTRSNDLIQHLIKNAATIFPGCEPCDLSKDVDFVNKLYTEEAKPILPSGEIEENRELQRESLDKDEGLRRGEFKEPDSLAKIRYSDDVDTLVKINIAFKTLQLLGQVIRNFPGSLLRQTKVDLAKAAYLLGLRTLREVLSVAENNIDELRSYLSELIQEHRSFDSNPRELARVTDEAVIGLTKACAYSVIKRISYSVGMEELAETYKTILGEMNEQLSIRLIDLSIKLDHFSAFPEEEIRSIFPDLSKNPFALTVLLDLVYNYLLLFKLDEGHRASITSYLGIKRSDPKYIDSGTKRIKYLRAGGPDK